MVRFFGAGAIVCTRLAAKGEGAAAVAVMIGGMTVANVIGVPAATFVSNLLVWRYLFAIVALFGLLAFVASACLFGVGGPPQYLIVGFSKGGRCSELLESRLRSMSLTPLRRQ